MLFRSVAQIERTAQPAQQETTSAEQQSAEQKKPLKPGDAARPTDAIAGLLLGSPEFQRR